MTRLCRNATKRERGKDGNSGLRFVLANLHSKTDNNIINIQGAGKRARLLEIFGALAEDQSFQHKCQADHNYL